jgi:hypothetical protein
VERNGVGFPAGLSVFLWTAMSKPQLGLIQLPFQWLPKRADDEATTFWCIGTQFADICTTSRRGPSKLAQHLISKPYFREVPVSTLGQGTYHPDKILVIISKPLIEFRYSTSIRRQPFPFPFQFITTRHPAADIF